MGRREESVMRYIEPNPHRPGPANVRIAKYGVPVWALIGYFNAVSGDPKRVAEAYDIPLDAVEEAIAYYQGHKAIIDARIAANKITAA